MSDEQKVYLGDGVYAANDGYQIKIICDCMSESNAIYLEPNVYMNLVRYAEKIWDIKKEKTE